jgi:hypothetical protein
VTATSRPGHPARPVDHILFGARDLHDAVESLHRRLGVRAAGGGQHPGRGTHNALLALGPRTYLEIIAPDPGQPEPDGPRPYGVDGLSEDGLVGWALACDDVAAALAQARAAGFDPGDVIDGRRVTDTGSVLRWSLTRNALRAGLVPFLIGWGDTPHPARSAPAGLTLQSLHIEHPQPASLAVPLRALGADVPVRQATTAALVVTVTGPAGPTELR